MRKEMVVFFLTQTSMQIQNETAKTLSYEDESDDNFIIKKYGLYGYFTRIC